MKNSPFESENFTLTTGEVVRISPLEVSDYEAFEKHREQFARETTFTYQTPEVPLDREKITARWKAMASGNSDFLFKVEDSKGNIISTFGLHMNFRHHPWVKHLAVFGMGVLKSHWGTGLAPRLIEILEEVARHEGVTRIEAQVRVENERGVAFYKKMGYEIEGTRRKAAFINGRYQDEYFIAKLL